MKWEDLVDSLEKEPGEEIAKHINLTKQNGKTGKNIKMNQHKHKYWWT